jgi:integrase
MSQINSETTVPRVSPRPERDASRRVHFPFGANTGSMHVAFEEYQSWVLNEGVLVLKPCELTLACLLALDAFILESDLRSAYCACASAYRWKENVRIEWQTGMRRDARYLSSMTTLASDRVSTWISYEEACAGLISALANRAGATAIGTVGALLGQSSAWLQSCLSPVLFAHLTGDNRLAALARETLARQETQQALLRVGDSLAASSTRDAAYVLAYDAALLGQPMSRTDAAAFVRKYLKLLRPPAGGTKAHRRDKVIEQVLELQPLVDHLNEYCALLYAFGLSLCESGTVHKKKLAPTTPSDYAKSFAEDFLVELDGNTLSQLTPEQYASIYRRLLQASPLTTDRVAGLKAFHRFLRTWWNVPALPSDVLDIEIETRVAANVVWPHEMALMRQWIAELKPSRFGQQLAAAAAICGAGMVRRAELTKLRLMNFDDRGDHVVIEIAREIVDGTEKSPEGRRRVTIKDPACLGPIRCFIKRRGRKKEERKEEGVVNAEEENTPNVEKEDENEDAAPGDYLFGDPKDPSKLRDIGRMLYWLNKLLKAVTGDDSVSQHTLRHSIATPALLSMLLNGQSTEVNALDELANEAGHVGGHITAAFYCHLFEQALRLQVDQVLTQWTLQYVPASKWSGASYDLVRQLVSRGSPRFGKGPVALWNSTAAASGHVKLPNASEGIAVQTPVSPLPEHAPETAPDFTLVLAILGDCASERSISQVSIRHDVEESTVRTCLAEVGRFSEINGEPPDDLLDPIAIGLHALREPAGVALGMRPDFARVSQSRWRALARGIESLSPSVLSESVRYWSRNFDANHLAARHGAGWVRFVELLGASQINTSLMAVEYHHKPQKTADHTEPKDDGVDSDVALAQAALRVTFGITVVAIERAYRPGRPPIRLVISSRPPSKEESGTADSIAGLHCCMLAAHVWLRVSEAFKPKEKSAL